MGDREQLRQRFNRAFAEWGIELPSNALPPGVVRLIVQRGWTIWTRFDIGDEDGRMRLDYYAMHRMTGDSHVRMYADGEEESLPTMAESWVFPQGASVAEEKEAHDNYLAHNQEVEKLLEEKSFVVTDQAHPSARLKRHLQTHPDAEDRR